MPACRALLSPRGLHFSSSSLNSPHGISLHLKAGRACPSLPHVEVFYPAQTQAVPCRLTCCCLSLAHKSWLSSGALLFVHLLPHSSATTSSCTAAITSFCSGLFFSSSLCPISVFSSPALQPGHTLLPHSDSTQAGLIPSVPECPSTFSILISPSLCPPSCPRPTAVHSHLSQGERSSSSQLNQLSTHGELSEPLEEITPERSKETRAQMIKIINKRSSKEKGHFTSLLIQIHFI